MLKRVTVFVVVAVAVVLAVQVLLREGPPRSLVVPPSMKLPALDDIRERERPQAAPAAAERREDVSAAAPATPDDPPAAADGSRRVIYDCGNGVLFAVRAVPGEVTVVSPQALGGEVITLPQVDAASGARYAVGGVSYWNERGLATFELRERTFADCTSSPSTEYRATTR